MNSHTTLAALPRSHLHLQLLRSNGIKPGLLLYRDAPLANAFLPEERAVSLYLGREKCPGRASFLSDFRHNRRYYLEVEQRLRPLGIDTLILFLEGEPLERFIFDRRLAQRFQLWEDGLSHYIDLTSPAWYALRGLAQILSGFYPHGAMSRRAPRQQFEVFDRFERKNLRWDYPQPARQHRDQILFVGSPLVEDCLITRTQFRQGLARLVQQARVPLRYLAHPREALDRLDQDLAAVGIARDPDQRGVMQHVADWDYPAYVSAFSTALLDIGRPASALFVPALFGLGRPARELGRWPALPVNIARSAAEAGQLLRRLAQTPAAAP